MDSLSPRLHDVVVIGAGMAGLTAANIIRREGLDVVVVDKGRALGGRMATRRALGGRFDHGAQHFSARSDAFQAEVESWLDAGAARVWFRSQSLTNPQRGVESRHSGVDGMRGIAEHLAADLDVQTGVTVERMDFVGQRLRVVARDARIDAGSVVVTAPLPQTLAMLDTSQIRLPGDQRATLSSVEYDATLAVMATLDGESGLADGHAAFSAGPVAWIADNHDKGVSPIPAVTIHSSSDYAAVHLDEDVGAWTDDLRRAAEAILGVRILQAVGHRWRYSQPRTTLDFGSVAAATPRPVILAGEAFAGARIEGAFLSGEAAAEKLLERLG